MVQKFIVGVLALAITGCGKYSAPRPPEAVSPKAAEGVQVLPNVEGVTLNWEAPHKDRRGRELKQIDGYRIYRKEIERDSDILNPRVEYRLLTSLEDSHLVELAKLREAAKAEDKPTRRLKVDEALKKFAFVDQTVISGRSYVYKIVPFNQESVEGEIGTLYRVVFRGDLSQVTAIPYEDLAYQDYSSR